MFRRSSVGVATSRAGHHQHRSHRVLSSRVHFLDKGRSHPLGSCLSAPKICSLKPPAQRHSLALIPASVLPWEIASAHRIADGGGHLWFFDYAVDLALDLVQTAQDRQETVV